MTDYVSNRSPMVDYQWKLRAEKAEAEIKAFQVALNGLRDEYTVLIGKATDLMAERDRHRQVVEKIADLGGFARAILDQQEQS